MSDRGGLGPSGSGPHGSGGTPRDGTAPGSTVPPRARTADRLEVRKTYKLFIGGAFPRSESGRSYPVSGTGGGLLAHAARASRKDARDAGAAARAAFGGRARAT